MSNTGIRAGKAFVEFFIDDKRVNSGLAAVSKKLTKFGAIGAAATAPIIAGFAKCVASAVSLGGELGDMSKRTGVSAEKLSALRYAADQTGTDLGTVEKAFRALQKKGIAPAEFDRIAADLAAIPDETLRAEKAMKLFGKTTGAAILPMLADLPRLYEEARRLGLIMSTEDVAAADALGDAWSLAKLQLGALAVQIGVAVAGPLTDFLVWTQTVIPPIIEFINQNETVVTTVAAVAAVVAGVSAGMFALGTAISAASLAMKGMTVTAKVLRIALALLNKNRFVALASLVAGGALWAAAKVGLSAGDSVEDAQADLPLLQGHRLQQQVHAGMQGPSLRGPMTTAAVASATREVSRLGQIADSTSDIAKSNREILQVLKLGRIGSFIAGAI